MPFAGSATDPASATDGGTVVYRALAGVPVDGIGHTTITSSPTLAVTAVNADADVDLELALLTTAGVFLADRDAAGGWTARSVPAIGPDQLGAPIIWARLAAGDVDGDGLEDLLVAGLDIRVFLAVPHGSAPPPKARRGGP